MIGLEVIKQEFENNKNGISSDLLKKIALLKIEERFQNSLNSYSIVSMVERIAESDLEENDKQTLMKMLKDGLKETLEDMEDSIKDLFGSDLAKKEDNENRDKDKEDNENRNSENGIEGPKETPAENVTNNNDENDHRVIFNY